MNLKMVESALDPNAAVLSAVVPAGEPWMGTIHKGQFLRIVDLEGNQAVDTLFYNAADTDERYSASDTIRAQGNLYLTAGTHLMSNDGNVMLDIVADTCGRHDTLGGAVFRGAPRPGPTGTTTGALARETEPSLLLAVTWHESRWPVSAAATVWISDEPIASSPAIP